MLSGSENLEEMGYALVYQKIFEFINKTIYFFFYFFLFSIIFLLLINKGIIMTSETSLFASAFGIGSALAYALGGPQHSVAVIVAGVALAAFDKGQQGLQNAAYRVQRDLGLVLNPENVIKGATTVAAAAFGGIQAGVVAFTGVSLTGYLISK